MAQRMKSISELDESSWTNFLAQAGKNIAKGYTLPPYIVAEMLKGLPGTIDEARQQAHSLTYGGSYDPKAAMELAMMSMGGTAFGAPRGAIGAGPVWPKEIKHHIFSPGSGVSAPIKQMDLESTRALLNDQISKASFGPAPKTEPGGYAADPAIMKMPQKTWMEEYADMKSAGEQPPTWLDTVKETTKGPSSVYTPKSLAEMESSHPSFMPNIDPSTLPREVPFSIPERGKAVGFNVPAVHGTVEKPRGVPDIYGEPLAAGSVLKKDFGSFDLPPSEIGVHFGSPAAAQHFVDSRGFQDMYPRKFPVALKAQNPLEMKDIGSWGPSKISNELDRLGFSAREISEARYKHGSRSDQQIQGLRDYINSKGYDSIKYRNVVEDPGSMSYIMMNPAQVRSPWAKFDPTKLADPNLLSGVAGAAAVPFGLDQLESQRR